mmetsp:Transcript_55876/g.141691  ORF Transcript_55876/g.141691 Transcript_55876/m.141691 type:complete len:291 (+) Transcript_55876:126-998(+)
MAARLFVKILSKRLAARLLPRNGFQHELWSNPVVGEQLREVLMAEHRLAELPVEGTAEHRLHLGHLDRSEHRRSRLFQKVLAETVPELVPGVHILLVRRDGGRPARDGVDPTLAVFGRGVGHEEPISMPEHPTAVGLCTALHDAQQAPVAPSFQNRANILKPTGHDVVLVSDILGLGPPSPRQAHRSLVQQVLVQLGPDVVFAHEALPLGGRVVQNRHPVEFFAVVRLHAHPRRRLEVRLDLVVAELDPHQLQQQPLNERPTRKSLVHVKRPHGPSHDQHRCHVRHLLRQ